MKTNLKKHLILISVLCLLLFIAGCSKKTPPQAATQPPAANPAVTEPEEKSVKTGLAFITSLTDSVSAGESDGCAQGNSVIAAVTVDEAGKIVRCVIDRVEAKAVINSSGQITTPLDTVFPSMFEKGDEWCGQAKYLAEYFAGKTIEDIKKISVDEAGLAADSELKASVTFPIAPYIEAVTKAAETSQALKAASPDLLGVGVETNIIYSTNAANGKGSVLLYSTFTAVTTDTDGRVSSCLVDGLQCSIDFDSSGRLISDLTAVPPTKNEIGDGYGLKKASSIGKEWYEQTKALAEYVQGKTAAEIDGITVRADTSPSDEDMRATVTLKIGEFKKVLVKAINLIPSFSK